MPNYCHNELIISKNNTKDSIEDYKLFKNENIFYLKETNEYILSFKGILPMPKDYKITKELSKKYSSNDPLWYIYNCETWGTKWDAITQKVLFNENETIIHYDTAWAPGEYWLDKIAEKYSSLNFKFSCFEEGGFFEGKGTVKNGKWDWKIKRPSKSIEDRYEDKNK